MVKYRQNNIQYIAPRGIIIMRSSLADRIKCCTRLSVRPSVPSRASDFLETRKQNILI